MSPLQIALAYIAQGWAVIPIPHKAKRPTLKVWQNLGITAETAPQYFNGNPQNVGVQQGAASRGLTDVDLDCLEAIAAAPLFLPHRTARFGRASKPCSHWLYYTDLAQTEDKATLQFKDPEKHVVLEIRIGGGGAGAQTVFPESMHPSGEAIEWVDKQDVARIGGPDLNTACGRIAACSLIARHYPKAGGRHDAALVFGGFLARCGFTAIEARLFAEAVAVASNQPSDKRADMIRAAADCVDAFAAGREAAGFPKLAETFGEAVAKKCAEWLGFKGSAEARQAPTGAGDLPSIKIAAGELPRLVNETEAAILAANRGLYKRERQIVRIAEIEVIAADEVKTTALAIIEQDEHALLEDACASATYLKFNKKEETWVPVDAPITVVRTLRARKTRLRFPPLMGVISAPLILASGRIIDSPGYDARTGLYFNPLSTPFPPIPENPTQEDARAALDLLGDLLEEFPFTNEASKAVALSGFLTAVSRRAIDFAFMHAITAPAFGSGKSYLADLFCMLASGRCAPLVSPGRAPEEFEKRLDSALLKGLGAISIDNVNGILEGERLAQILSQGAVEIRLFGTQQNLTVTPASLVTATGVNLLVVEDLRRRTLLCSLDAREERPELRTFVSDPLSAIKTERGRYVAAAITIIRAFMAAGSPRQAAPVNGYAQYCGMVRDPLLWLGCADPCSTMEEIRQQDSRLTTKTLIAAQWLVIFGNQQKTTAEVVEEASRRRHTFDDDPLAHPELYAALSEVAKDGKGLSTQRLGHWLGRAKGSVITLESKQGPVRHSFQSELDTHTKAKTWRLLPV